MTKLIEHYRMPFSSNLGTPSRVYTQIVAGGVLTLYQVTYRVNSYDSTLVLTMVDISTGLIVCITKVIKNGNFFVRDANGRILFILFFNDPTPANPDIWIYSQDQIEAAVA